MQRIKMQVSGDERIRMDASEIHIIRAVSPVITLERNSQGALIRVRDVNGVATIQIYDGEKGEQGEQGEQGPQGERGPSYTLPTASSEVMGGVRIESTPTANSGKAITSGAVYAGLAGKVNRPATNPNGTSGQVLQTLGDGSTQWVTFGTPSAEEIAAAVAAWLDEHPEATTTVEDGSISMTKLATAVREILAVVPSPDAVVAAVENVEGGIQVTYGSGQTTTIPVSGGADMSQLHWYWDPDTGLLHMYDANDEDVLDPVEIAGGGGGGGGASTIALTNVVKPTTIRNGANANFSFTATSSDDTDVTTIWEVDGTEITTTSGISGATHAFNARGLLRESGSSVVKARITSEGGGRLIRTWTVNSTAFSLRWGSAIQPIMLYTANENVYAVIEVAAQSGTTNTVSVTVGQHTATRSVTGSRSITVELDKSWFATGADVVTAGMVSGTDATDTADEIHYTAIWAVGATGPIVAFAESAQSGTQYDTIPIRYMVYDPSSETAEATITIGEDEREVTVGRDIQTFRYVPYTSGSMTVTLESGQDSATLALTVAASEYNIGKVLGDNLRYDLDPTGHSNSDNDREQFGGITFSQNFDWTNGGFQADSDGAAAFVVKKGHRATLPRSLFVDGDTNGKTIDISFRIMNSDQYGAVAMTDTNNGGTKGIILRANEGEIHLDNAAAQAFRYCEGNRIDLSIHVEDTVAQRVSTVWLDGIPSKVNTYEAGMLVQSENAMVIGGDHCDVWVYAIRCYNSKLSEQDMMQNYISLGSSTAQKVARCQENAIFDENRNITPATLHAAAPNLTIITIAADRMTTGKKDKVAADITIQDGNTVLELERSAGAKFMVQGTSSVAYGRSALNMDLDFKSTGQSYQLSEGAVPVSYLNIKVNVASSENANNVCAVDWYNTYQPFLIPARQANPAIRDTIEGKPCAVFFTNTGSAAVWVSSQLVQPGDTILYVMGDLCNSKKNTNVFGQDGVGEHATKACIEVSGNDTACQRFRSAAAVYNAEDGEWQTTRIEDGKTVVQTEYEWRMEPKAADLDNVVSSWNAAVAWVVSTIGNAQKFHDELHNYFTPSSLLYHFLAIEYLAAYDNVSKNTFYSYDWDADEGGYRWNIKEAYDWDTILAYDNDGNPLGDFGLDYGDTLNGRSYFNAVDNPIFVNIQAGFQTELSALYIERRSAGAWDADAIIAKWDNYQAKRPHAAMVRDAYIKYIYPYKTTGVVINGVTLGYDDNYLSRLNGSKTYQRRQFFTYQTDYMDGKYGYYSKTNSTQFRTNGAAGTKSFTIKAYAKTYITVLADDNKVASQKVEAGGTATFANVSVGSNTTIYVTPDRLVQYIRPLNETLNSTFAASGALRLMEAVLGGEAENNVWMSGTGVNLPSPILKELSIRNLTNFSSALNLTPNVELESLDTRGTNAGRITLPPYAPLETVRLNACSALAMANLSKVETFTMESGENLTAVTIENCSALISNAMIEYLEDAFEAGGSATRSARLIGIDWTLEDTTLLNHLLTAGSIDAGGTAGAAPAVVTGSVYVPIIRQRELTAFQAAWPDLAITYGNLIVQYAVTFKDWDESPIRDIHGNAYIQYVDSGDDTVNPITAGDVATPTRTADAQYTYAFNGWDSLPTGVIGNKTVHATYTSTIRTYTVSWYDGVGAGDGMLLKQMTGQSYGASLDYGDDLPTYAALEANNIYYAFKGWDRSTGYITGDTKVHAQWVVGNLPDPTEGLTPGEVGAEGHYDWAMIRAIATNKLCDTYFAAKDHLDFSLGHDFNFMTGQSSEPGYVAHTDLVSQPTYFGANDAPIIFNGEGGRPLLQLFNGSMKRWTLAIDFECTGDTGALVSCFNSSGNAGLQLRRNGNYVNLLWGDTNQNVGYQYQRGILVIRYNGDYPKIVYIAHDGSGVNQSNSWSANEYVVNTSTPANNQVYVPLTRTTDVETTAPLTLGGIGYMDGTDMTSLRATGWIHWAKLWHEDLGEHNAKKLAIFPHLKQRYSYTGIKYQDDIDSIHTVAGGFLSEGLLPLNGKMNNTGTNAGGWRDCHRRAWLNGQFFKALPVELQGIIDDCQVRATKGGGSSSSHALEIYNSLDKVYLPAYAEAFNVTGSSDDDNAYRDERAFAGQQIIPYFTADTDRGMANANNSRVRIPGVIIPDDANYIVYSADPTTPGLTGYTIVSEKTIWIHSGNSNIGYVYVDADYVAKHKHLGGRLMTSSDNIDAAGADTAGHTGGKWVRVYYWWLRSPNVANSNDFWNVYYHGGNYYYNANYTFGLAPAFSI